MTTRLIDRDLDCFCCDQDSTRLLHIIRAVAWAEFVANLPGPQAAYLADTGFKPDPGALALLPGSDGIDSAVLTLGDDPCPENFGHLPHALPNRLSWRLAPGDYDPAMAVLGFCLGAYHFAGKPGGPMARIVQPTGTEMAQRIAGAIWWARDLVNEPANRLGPAELAAEARQLAARHQARFDLYAGAALDTHYPTIAAVGAGSDRPPCVAVLEWTGSAAPGGDTALPSAPLPLISLCGKGVCFDTGGNDIKPSAGMLRMKKDMGGAAIALGVARLVMEANLPVRLQLRIGCVENSVSGRAMRPGDILRTRKGLTVEIGNTDAEGRLVLCDLLDDAAAAQPDLLLDFATLTGAARIALGPDLPALMTNNDHLAEAYQRAALSVHDPVWRLPLWPGYDSWLKSPVADLNNVSSQSHAGAITAGLYLQRFVPSGIRWAHLDTYAWSDRSVPGHPEGGDTQGLRAAFAMLLDQIPAYAIQRGDRETLDDSNRFDNGDLDSVAKGT